MSEGLGDVGGTGQAEKADGKVAQGGHDAGAVAGADLGAVLVEGDVTDPVQAVFHAPVAADPGRELGIGGLRGSQAGNRIDDFGPPFLVVELAGAASDLDRLGSVREQDPGGYGDDLEGALLYPAMTRP